MTLQEDGDGIGENVTVVEEFLGQGAVAFEVGGRLDGEVVEVTPFAVVRDDEFRVVGEVELGKG